MRAPQQQQQQRGKQRQQQQQLPKQRSTAAFSDYPAAHLRRQVICRPSRTSRMPTAKTDDKVIIVNNPSVVQETAKARGHKGGGGAGGGGVGGGVRRKPPIIARAPIVQTAAGVEVEISNSSSSTHSSGNNNDNDKNNKNNSTTSNNKVYKYFSTSAKHEYKRGEAFVLTEDEDLSSVFGSDSRVERECFHINEKICPICDAPLKNYESCCLRCQRDLSLQLHNSNGNGNSNSNSNIHAEMKVDDAENSNPSSSANVNGVQRPLPPQHSSSFALVCVSCERVYQLCASCVRKHDVCRACHRKRNVCMNCRRSLCAFCLDEIACGRNTERTHVNETDKGGLKGMRKEVEVESVAKERVGAALNVFEETETPNDCAFHILDAQVTTPTTKSMLTSSESSTDGCTVKPEHVSSVIHNNLRNVKSNYNKHNISFKPLPKIADKRLWIEPIQPEVLSPALPLPQPPPSSSPSSPPLPSQRTANGSVSFWYHSGNNNNNKYYESHDAVQPPPSTFTDSDGDANCDQSTQTAPLTAARRDVVLHEEHLAMPLLSEMPKMTRHDNLHWLHNFIQQTQQQSHFNKSTVLTEVGAISRQLKAAKLQSAWRTYELY